MATRFEIVLHGDNPISLRAAGEEALEEIDWVEAQLSIYRTDSQINHVNQRAAHGPVKLEPTIFQLVKHCAELTHHTDGAFDITLGPLIRCWGFMGGSGHLPSPESIQQAKELVGMHHVVFDDDDYSVRFDREGVMLDLGSIGKGFALERAKEILEENGIESALIHGGTSTVATIGTPPDQATWKIAITRPQPADPESNDTEQKPITIGLAELTGNSLSVSAVWGKSFQTEDREYGHVIDGRTGEPTTGAAQAAVTMASATDADAISTALLVDGNRGIPWLERYAPVHEYCLIKPGKRPLMKGITPIAPPKE